MITIGFVAALFISVALAFLLEFLDRSIHSEEDVEQTLGIASLGLVPSLKRSWGASRRASAYVVQHPTSAYAESIRNLCTGLRLSSGDHLPHSMLIVSSLPNEGKTTVVVSLAALLSAAGLRTIVVDTDLRKSTIHDALGVAARPGLADYLKRRLPLAAAIQQDETTGVDVITAGTPVANPPDLLGADQMKELLEQLKSTYDAVILDSAPLLAASDVRVLLRMVDKIVFLVRWGDTRRDVALRALHQVGETRDNMAGAMLTMVDLAKYAKYNYGSFGAYYRRIQHYYAA
jgi:capsular exopolysaccharide synthesis family protein